MNTAFFSRCKCTNVIFSAKIIFTKRVSKIDASRELLAMLLTFNAMRVNKKKVKRIVVYVKGSILQYKTDGLWINE